MEDEYTESFGFSCFADGVETCIAFDIYGGATLDDIVAKFKQFLIALQYAPETVDRVRVLNA